MTLESLSLFQTTKKDRINFCETVVSNLENGNADALVVHLQLKSMEDIIKQLNDNSTYKSYLLEAAEKNGKKFTFQNSEFNIREVGVKYDFTQCGDLELNDLQEKLNGLTEEVKARQTFLKTVQPKGMIVTSQETGDTYTVYPPSKTSTTSVAVTLK